MEKFPQKLKSARLYAEMTQTELAAKAGLSRRSIFAYENGAAVPRQKVLRRLASVLDVTVSYLTDDSAVDPREGWSREENINLARRRFGEKGAREASDLLDRNSAFFAGGDIPQEDKDAFFDAVMVAYVTAKEEARKRFSAKNPPSAEKP